MNEQQIREDERRIVLEEVREKIDEKPMSVFSFNLKGEELERYMRYKGYNECRGEIISLINKNNE